MCLHLSLLTTNNFKTAFSFVVVPRSLFVIAFFTFVVDNDFELPVVIGLLFEMAYAFIKYSQYKQYYQKWEC